MHIISICKEEVPCMTLKQLEYFLAIAENGSIT